MLEEKAGVKRWEESYICSFWLEDKQVHLFNWSSSSRNMGVLQRLRTAPCWQAPRKRGPPPYSCSELNSANTLYILGRGFCPRASHQESSLPLCKLTNTSRKKKNIVYRVSDTTVNTLQKLIHFCLHFMVRRVGQGEAQNLPWGYSGWQGMPGVGMHLALDQRTSSCISSFSLYTPAGTRVHSERCWRCGI